MGDGDHRATLAEAQRDIDTGARWRTVLAVTPTANSRPVIGPGRRMISPLAQAVPGTARSGGGATAS